MPRALGLLAALALLAGCAAPPPPEEPPREDPPPTGGPAPATEMPLEPLPRPAPLAHSKPFAFQGTTEGEACPAVGDAEQCQELAPAANATWPFPDATVLRADGEVRWSAASPASEEMYAVLYRVNGTTPESLGDQGFAVLGPSPLAFAWDLAVFPPETRYQLGLFQGVEVNRYPVAVVYLGTPQAFEVEGKLVVASAPQGTTR